MPSELLSRRRLFAAGSALAVTAAATTLPAIAEALPATAPALPPAAAELAALPALSATEPTPIEKLWADRNAIREQARAAYRVVGRLKREAWESAGAPSREITYSAPNERLGLERWGVRTPYIDPLRIEAALRGNGSTVYESKVLAGRLSIVSKRQAAREKRLKALLKISRPHHAKVQDYLETHGYAEANDKAELLTSKQGALEWRILKMPSKNVHDLEIKFVLAKNCDDSCNHPGALSIAADLRRLMKRPALATAFAEA